MHYSKKCNMLVDELIFPCDTAGADPFLIEEGVLKCYVKPPDVTEVIVPEGVTHISPFVHFDENIKSITLPEGLIAICGFCFMGCKKLEHIAIPKTVEAIGSGSFRGCEKIESLELPQRLCLLGPSAFENCTNLKEIHIPDNVEELWDETFRGCVSLKKVTLPRDLFLIAENVFVGCESLQDIYYLGSREEWDEINISENSGIPKSAVIHYGR